MESLSVINQNQDLFKNEIAAANLQMAPKAVMLRGLVYFPHNYHCHQCCMLAYLRDQDKKYQMVLKNMEIRVRVDHSIATIELVQRYTNEADKAFEATYMMPMDEDTILSKLVCQVDETVVQANIEKKEVAE
jgi:hypothetical protein